MKTCAKCGSQIQSTESRCPRCDEQFEERAKTLRGITLAGKYLIEEPLGSGGMCDIYRATHMGMGKRVAVKVLKPQLAVDSQICKRFEQEAHAASRIHHPNAINVIDYGESDDHQPFIVMEYVDGITLGELLRRHGALSVERAANILRQVCGALDAAHDVGVIHRDIKPENILIAAYGDSDWVEVLDFGIAKIQDDVNRRASLTGANIIVGTPRYMSPEQCEEKPVDARSDIYSLGVVLYEMLAGEAPYDCDSSTRLLVAHTAEPPIPLRQKRPDVSTEIEAVVLRALEKNPSRRPQTAGEFAREFDRAAGISQHMQAGALRGGAFSRINVPLGSPTELAERAVDGNAETLDDQATVVRRRRIPDATPAANIADSDRVDTPYAINRAGQNWDDLYIRRGSSTIGAPRRSAAGWIVGILVLLVVAGVAAYIVWGGKLFGGDTNTTARTGDTLVDAMSAITDARARIDSLPQDHPLRRYIEQLSQWQGELKAYQQVSDRSPQITEKAERYMQQAENISAQARAALIALGRDSSNANSAVPTNSNSPSTAVGSPQLPPRPSEVSEPSTENVNKAETEKEAQDRKDKKENSDVPPPPPPPPPDEKKGADNTNKGARKPPPPIPVKPNNTNKPPDIW